MLFFGDYGHFLRLRLSRYFQPEAIVKLQLILTKTASGGQGDRTINHWRVHLAT